MAGRATQITRRVAIEPDSANTLVTQLTRRVAIQPDDSNVSVTQITRRVALVWSSGQFTADAVIDNGASTVPGDFSAAAAVQREQSASLEGNSVVKRTQSSPLSIDAVLHRPVAASLTTDAIVSRSREATFPAEAWIFGPGSGAFSADAVVRQASESALAVDAVLLRAASTSLTTDAIVARQQGDSFNENAVVLRGPTGSLTATAVIARQQDMSSTADAVTRVIITPSSLIVDAIIRKTVSGASQTFTVEAWIGRVFLADAVIAPPPSLTADAVISATVGDGTFTLPQLVKVAGYYQVGTGDSDGTYSYVWINKPPGITVGEYILAAISYDALGNSYQRVIPAVSGWTEITTLMLSNGDGALSIWIRAVTASEPSYYRFDLEYAATPSFRAQAIRISGEIGSTLLYQYANTSYTSTHSTPAMTTPNQGVLVVINALTIGQYWMVQPAGTEEIKESGPYGYAGLGSWVITPGTVLPANIGIKTATTGWGQYGYTSATLIAGLILLPTGRWFTADAIVKRTVFEADAYIFEVNQHLFWADAIIGIQIFYDDFEREVAEGLGGTWTLEDSWPQAAYVTDGYATQPNVQHSPTSTYWDSSSDYSSGLPGFTQGLLSFDIRTGDANNGSTYIQIEQSQLLPEWGVDLYSDEAGGYWWIQPWWVIDWLNDPLGPLTSNTWYTVKIFIEAMPDGDVRVKVWERGTPEPDWEYSDKFEWDNDYIEYDESYYRFNSGDDPGTPLDWDNFRVVVTGGKWRLQNTFSADAWFYDTKFKADAVKFLRAEDLFIAYAVITDLTYKAIFLANAIIHRVSTITKTANAVIYGPRAGSKTLDAWINNAGELTRQFSFTANAHVGRTFTVNAVVKEFDIAGSCSADSFVVWTSLGSFTAKASLYKLIEPVTGWGDFLIDAWVIGTVESFVADAQVSAPTTPSASFTSSADLSASHRSAVLSADSWIRWLVDDVFAANATIVISISHVSRTFTANAETRQPSFIGSAVLKKLRLPTLTANAIVRRATGPTITANAWIWNSSTPSGGVLADAWLVGTTRSFTAAANILKEVPKSFTADASIPSRFFANAVIWRSFTVYEIENAALISLGLDFTLTANAVVMPVFVADAFVRPYFRADAYIAREVIWRLWFSANAVIYDPRWFTANAYLYKSGVTPPPPPTYTLSGTVTIGGSGIEGAWVYIIAADGTQAGSTITGPGGTWSIVVPAGTYTIYVVPPVNPSQWYGGTTPTPVPVVNDVSGVEIIVVPTPPYVPPPAGDPNPPPVEPPPPGPVPVREDQRIRILVRKSGVTTEITKDVIWSETEFTQQARTGPGAFQCTLRGDFTSYDGGEDIYVEIDGYRQFGGLITMVEYGYFFPNKAEPKTILRGTDYNIYFDRLVLWNKDDNTQHTGADYKPPPTFIINSSDKYIIQWVCNNLIDYPPGLNWHDYVDVIDATLNESARWMVNTGQTLRSFMAEISTITNGVWWIDQFLNLHYHPRNAHTAPSPITDDKTGVSGQNLEIRVDTSQMVNDIFVYGTLTKTVSGQIYLARRDRPETIASSGRRQYFELRSDLHNPAHINKRANSIKTRRSWPLHYASIDIWEPGFSIGQVVQVISSTYDYSHSFVIKQVRTRFPVAESADGEIYYGVPQYHLELGLEPDDPWNMYDMLPWDMPPWDQIGSLGLGFTFPIWRGWGICAATSSETCVIAHTVTLFDEDGFGFGDLWPTTGWVYINVSPKGWAGPTDIAAANSNVWPYQWAPYSYVTYNYPSPLRIAHQDLLPSSTVLYRAFNALMSGHIRGGGGTSADYYGVMNRNPWGTPIREFLASADMGGWPGYKILTFAGTDLTYPLGIDLEHKASGGPIITRLPNWRVEIKVESTGKTRLSGEVPQIDTYTPSYGTVNPYTRAYFNYPDAVIPESFWIRIRFTDTNMLVKIWDICEKEPDEWYSSTDSVLYVPPISVGVMITTYTQSLTEEIQFGSIEVCSGSGFAYLQNTPEWAQYMNRPDTIYDDDTPGTIWDLINDSGPWPIQYSNGWTSTYTYDDDPTTLYANEKGTSWNYTIRDAQTPDINPDTGLQFPDGDAVAFSQNDPEEGTTFSRSTVISYVPEYVMTTDANFRACFDWPDPEGGYHDPSEGYELTVQQVQHSGKTRSVMRLSYPGFTFHFKAKVVIGQSLNFYSALFYRDDAGAGPWIIQFWKYNFGTGTPTGHYTVGLANKEQLLAQYVYIGWSSFSFGVPVDVEWSYTFQPGETYLNYGVELPMDGKEIGIRHGVHGGILFGPPTRTFNVLYEDVQVWVTWDEPRPDPLNGISRLPGPAVPLSALTRVNGYLDSSSGSLQTADLAKWGWLTETVMVDKSGFFHSSVGAVRGYFSVWYAGDRLTPVKDWNPVDTGNEDDWRAPDYFRLTDEYRRGQYVSMVTLTYLTDSPAMPPSWSEKNRPVSQDRRADRSRMLDVRGLD